MMQLAAAGFAQPVTASADNVLSQFRAEAEDHFPARK